MQFQDYYNVLGVARNASDDEIKRAYRQKAREFHPDVNKSADAEEKFKAVNEAYQVLSDTEKRSMYDRFGADWERYQSSPDAGSGADFAQWFTGRQSGGPGNPNMRFEYRTSGGEGHSDFFETLFGSTGQRSRRRGRTPRRGEDHEYPIEVTLRDAFTGVTRTFELQVPEPCDTCGGVGLAGGTICDGCDGGGSVSRRSRIEVSIPAGIRDGQRVRVAGKGAPGRDGGKAGDVYLKVRVKPDMHFSLDGNELKTEVEVPLYTAILGGETIVKTLTGKVALNIPAQTQNGRVFRLRGQGWPISAGSTERGDLLARVSVALPKDLSDDELHMFEQLRDMRSATKASAAA